MWNKNFFRTLNRAKCAKYVFVISGLFLVFSLSCVTGMVSAEEFPQTTSASDKLDQTVRFILQNSIHTIQEAHNYSTYLHCQAKIMGKVFNGKGEFYQKREMGLLKTEEILSSRWEVTFYLPNFKFYQLSVLNGNQKCLWTLTERRNDGQKDPNENSGEIQYVNLASVRAMIEKSPLEYTSISHPWYSQPNVAQILEGILKSFQFTMAGETQFPGTNLPIYQIEGQMKPELTKEILESRGLDPAAGIFALPGDVPMCVELLIDKAQGLPIQIQFYRVPSREEDAPENPEDEYSYTILFEQSHLNDVSLDDSFFEISRGYETHDVTEQYLENHRSK